MSWLAALVAAILKAIGNSVTDWLKARQQAADERQTGAASEAASQAVQGEKAAQAMAQAATDAPRAIEAVESELDRGKF